MVHGGVGGVRREKERCEEREKEAVEGVTTSFGYYDYRYKSLVCQSRRVGS